MPGRQDALGGNSKTVVVANVAPGAGSVRETLSTLGFAQRAKQIVTRAVVNEEASGEAALLAAENARLRRELAMFRALQQARAPRLPAALFRVPDWDHPCSAQHPVSSCCPCSARCSRRALFQGCCLGYP